MFPAYQFRQFLMALNVRDTRPRAARCLRIYGNRGDDRVSIVARPTNGMRLLTDQLSSNEALMGSLNGMTAINSNQKEKTT
jgi:hypothetical protein